MTTRSSRPMVPPLPTAWGFDDACALARAYAQGAADPVAVTERCLQKAKELPCAYISYSEERALREAEAARARYKAGAPLSLLDGVPLGWKDIIAVGGSVTTAGSELRRDLAPEKADAPLPLMAARAGLVCTGKTNTTEFAYSSIGTNPHYGTPVNPHSKAGDGRIPGGSSSGSAVAVAAGALPLAIGSDTGGSIRIPAAFNGIVGFKPSVARYPREGMTFLARTMDTAGPMTRSVRDAVVLDRILCGCPCAELPSVPSLKSQRFVLDEALLADPSVTPCVLEATRQAVQRLEQAGAVVERRRVEPFHAAMASIRSGWLLMAEAFTGMREILDDPARAAKLDPIIRKRAEAARTMPVDAAVRSYWDRENLRAAMRRDLGNAVLLTPAVPHAAPAIAALEADEAVFFHYIANNIRLTTPGNLTDMPGISLPAGLDKDGLPIGLLLSAPSGADENVLQAALAAEEAVCKG